MRDDNYYSSASMSEYIHWVMKDKLHMTDREMRDYVKLVDILANIEFIWIHPMDVNRAMDGLELRSDFEYETGGYIDKSSGLLQRCSFFEMLAALAIRCENQLMRNLSIGDRTSRWFFEFLNNIGLDNKSTNEKEVRDILENVMTGNFATDGSGGMFPLKKRRGINQRSEQIWKQMSAYINENYFHEDPDLLLFN